MTSRGAVDGFLRERSYEIVGAAFDLGSPARGTAEGPRALREARLMARLGSLEKLGVSVTDGGDVTGATEGTPGTNPRNLPEMLSFSRDLMERLGETYASGRVPVVIGGDHSSTVPSVAAAAEFLRALRGDDARLGLLYVDAHPDLEVPLGSASESGDLHGMSVSHLLGYGVDELANLGGFGPKLDPSRIAMVGLRDVLTEEREIIREREIQAYSFIDVERLGIVEIAKRVFGLMAERCDGFVLSFDIDACDPLEAPAVLYPEPGGLTYREATISMEEAARAEGLLGLEMVEVCPARDPDAATAKLAVSLLRTALGGIVL